MVINWELIEDLKKKGMEIPHVLDRLGVLTKELIAWGADYGIDEKSLKAMFWDVYRTEPMLGMERTFVRIRQRIMVERPMQ